MGAQRGVHLRRADRASPGALRLGRISLAGLALAWIVGCAGLAADDPLKQYGWVPWNLPGKRATIYAADHSAGRPAIRADADASASMLRRSVGAAAPVPSRIRFSWRIADLIAGADLRDAAAEDAPVRIVLAFEGDHTRLSPRNRMLFDLAHAVTGERPPYATLMYVWDNRAAVETVIHAARTDRIRKIVVESGGAQRGRWRDYERPVADDFRRAFGEEPGRLVGVALMTDADNTGSSARAWYGKVELIDAAGQSF